MLVGLRGVELAIPGSAVECFTTEPNPPCVHLSQNMSYANFSSYPLLHNGDTIDDTFAGTPIFIESQLL